MTNLEWRTFDGYLCNPDFFPKTFPEGVPPIRFTHTQAFQASLKRAQIPLGELVKLNPKLLK